jgi:mannose-6-phosphate isomerase-like protein (cupin superfamily)
MGLKLDLDLRLLQRNLAAIEINVSQSAGNVRVTLSEMPKVIERPSRIEAAGNKPKTIDEYIGRVNSGNGEVSIAHMRSPEGWSEPDQRPEFDEYTVVLSGTLQVDHDSGSARVRAGQAIIVSAGERVRYSTPEPGGAEYIAVCLPAFSIETVHREAGQF